MCKKLKLTKEDKTNLSILASILIMVGALLFVVWCFMRIIEIL